MDADTIIRAFAHLLELYPALRWVPVVTPVVLVALRHIRVSRHSWWGLLCCRMFGECAVEPGQTLAEQDTQPIIYGNGLLVTTALIHVIGFCITVGRDGFSVEEKQALVAYILGATGFAAGLGSTIHHQVQTVKANARMARLRATR